MDLDRILVSNAMMPTTSNTPLDARIVVEDRESIAKIQVPYVGMVFYVKDEGLLYVVKSLKSKELFGVSIPNALVDEYEPLISSEMNHAIEVILDSEKTMEQNKAIWENVQQLSGANNIVESLQNILTGKNQDEILDITEDDIGKILSVGQNENGEVIAKAIDAVLLSKEIDVKEVEYTNENQPELKTLADALDYLVDNCRPEIEVDLTWDQILGKPEVIADGLMLTDEALILKDGEEDISSVDLMTDEDLNNILGSLSD